MPTLIAKKTFSIKTSIASQLEKYSNKSKFVNEALSFYIDYLDNIENYKNNLLEKKIRQALVWDFYGINFSNSSNKNNKKYSNHSKKLEDNISLAINE